MELSPNSTLLAAGFYSERREKQRFSGLKDTPSEEGYQGELQHIWAEPAVRLTTGISTYNFNVHQEPPSFISEQGELVEPPAEDFDSGYAELYNYLNLNPHEMLDLTIGLAADHYNRGELDRNKISPKAGIMWSPMPELKLRAAALRTVKRSLVVEQTLGRLKSADSHSSSTTSTGRSVSFTGSVWTPDWQVALTLALRHRTETLACRLVCLMIQLSKIKMRGK